MIFPSKQIPILMYHSLNPSRIRGKLAVSEALFRKQIGWLKSWKLEILTLEQCADFNGRIPFYRASAALTFDDGYRDNYTAAFSVLREAKLPVTFFVNTGLIGTEGFMDWAMLKEMAGEPGISIQSHGAFHESMNEMSAEKAYRSLADSKKILEDRLGKPVQGFSYPLGAFNRTVMELAQKAGYSWACAASRIPENLAESRYSLKRIKISHTSNNALAFWWRISGWYS